MDASANSSYSLFANVSELDQSALAESPPLRRTETQRLLNQPTRPRNVSQLHEPDSIVVISSDEEDNTNPTPAVRRRNNRTQRRFLTEMTRYNTREIIIEIGSPDATVRVNLDGPLNSRRRSHLAVHQRDNNYTRGNVQRQRQVPETTFTTDPAPTQPPAKPAAVSPPVPNSQRPPNSSPATGKEIIFPICYESLADRSALSTICGHIFCVSCIKRAQQITKACPI
uniref:RING-type domain-containing protein n=1 Tax=Anopheles epiroticus TaxID=199890 RepID=A0A182PQG3_9DIPT